VAVFEDESRTVELQVSRKKSGRKFRLLSVGNRDQRAAPFVLNDSATIF
jgi:hypothetical protein